MKILGIDPGDEQSALVVYDSENNEILLKEILKNDSCVDFLRNMKIIPDCCVIEEIACYGMPVGENVFKTVFWSGRFAQILIDLNFNVFFIKRNKIKNILCHSSKAKDANIRQRLIDIFGKIGTKKNPGKLYGVKKDMWAALAVAYSYYLDIRENNNEIRSEK